MSDAELLELAKLSQASFHNRRAMEWRLLLGYWGGVVLIVFGVLSGKVSATSPVVFLISAALVLLVLVVIFFCILPIQRAHAADQQFFLYYTRRVEGIATEADRPTAKIICLNRAWTAGQILFSILLTLIAVTLVLGAAKP